MSNQIEIMAELAFNKSTCSGQMEVEFKNQNNMMQFHSYKANHLKV